MSTTSDPTTITLECTIPEGTKVGDVFNIEHEGRAFEITMPEGALVGQQLNVIAPKTKYESIDAVIASTVFSATAVAENLNAKYNIVDRVKAGITLVTEKAKAIDEQYKVSSSSLAAKALDTANNLKEQALRLNEKYQIVDKVKGQVDRLVVWGKEIDVKYALTATAARLIVSGVNSALDYKQGTKTVTAAASAVNNASAPAAAVVETVNPVVTNPVTAE